MAKASVKKVPVSKRAMGKAPKKAAVKAVGPI